MAIDIDMHRLQREAVRWRVLAVLDSGRPESLPETLILTAVGAAKLDATTKSLRNELDYLEKRGLVEISNREGSVWFAELTRHGVDVVEYTVACEPGIDRPRRE